MTMVIAGIAAFASVATLAVLFVYPFVFNGVLGLFENNDLGVVIALAVCVLITFPMIWLAMGLTFGAVFLTAVGIDRQNRNRRRRLRDRR